jgi:hypothetical protein
MRLRNIVRWRTKKQRWRSTSLICRVHSLGLTPQSEHYERFRRGEPTHRYLGSVSSSCPLLLEATQLVQLVDARSNNGSPIGKIQEARGGLPQ